MTTNSLQLGKYLHTFDKDGKYIESRSLADLPVYEKCALICKAKKEKQDEQSHVRDRGSSSE